MVGGTGTEIADTVPLNPALSDIAFRVDYQDPGSSGGFG
jgi:hypothetical protein